MHLVEFNSEEDFKRFMQDDERKAFLHLKDASIRLVCLIGGDRMI